MAIVSGSEAGRLGPRVEDERLVAFLSARIGEDEAARAATPGRVLREVAAKRRRLEDYRQAARACRSARPGQGPPLLAYRDACYRAVLADAAIWDGHPDYEHRWKLG